MHGLLQRVLPWAGVVLALIAAGHPGLVAAQGLQGYLFRGRSAPQVQSSPLVAELEQKLRQLRDRLKSRSRLYSLAAAIEQGLLHNPELAQAYAQIQQAEWNLIAVRRLWYPTLSASSAGPSAGLWGYGGGTTRSAIATAAATVDRTTYQNLDQLAARLSLNWTFFDPSRAPQINAGNDTLRSERLLFDVAARNLVLQIQLAYFGLQEQQQLIASYQEILEATTNQVRQVEALFNIGNASIADVEQIRTQQYQTLSLLIRTNLSLIDDSASLASAMALPPGELVLPADRLERYGQWEMPLETTLQQAQVLREEIQSSLAQASSARWRASALLNRYWPRFSLAANGTYFDLNSRSGLLGTSSPDRLNTSSWDGSVGIGFTWSIFDGGIAAAEAQASKARGRQFADQAAVQRLQISQEVEQSFASYETSRLALLSTREQAASAQQAAIAVRERFNVGYSDITSVVQTLNQAINAANAYSLSQREYNNSVARLYRASAQWPENAQALRTLRVQQLRQR